MLAIILFLFCCTNDANKDVKKFFLSLAFLANVNSRSRSLYVGSFRGDYVKVVGDTPVLSAAEM